VNPDWPCPAQPQKRDAYTSSSFSLSLCYDKSNKSKGKYRILMKKAVYFASFFPKKGVDKERLKCQK
jgi:hypothetical protein